MYSDVPTELTKVIKKLYTLEESIINTEKMDNKDLRSKQALLISEVIQSLQELESTIRRESHVSPTKQQNSLINV